MKNCNGDVYAGLFNEGERHGPGLHLKAFNQESYGDFYCGEFSKDVSEGLGIYSFSALKESYLGQWVSGQFEGYGMYRHNNASIYMGKFH